MRNSDESPSSRHRHHHYQSKSKSKVDADSGDDLNEEERYRQEDLRTKLNQLKKGKDHHKDRVSSSDREQHDKHRNSRQLQVHDYDANYYKSSSKKESYSRDYNYQQKHHSHHYQQERSYSSDSRNSSDQKRSSKTSSSNAEKYVETESKSEKHIRSKIKIEAEVNEIVSEEEKSSANESNDEEKTKKLKKSNKKDKESNDDKKATGSKEQSPKEEVEESENIRAEIALRNKLKRRIQEAEVNQSDEDDDDSTKKTHKEKRKQRKDDSSNSRSPRKQRSDSTSSTVSNAGSNRNSDQQSQSVGSNQSDSESTESEYNDKTPDRESLRTDSESERDELDEKMEDYYKKMATKKPIAKIEEPKVEAEKKGVEEAAAEPIAPPPPPPEIVTYYCAIQGSRSVEEFECLNKIEEGAYGVVFRAKDKKSNEVVALKRLKMEKEKEGFPITSIREIDTLLKSQHPNVVTVREIVVGSNMDKIYMVMDYVEHDLKSLMQYSMKKPFMMSEVKTLMIQLLRGVAHLHDNWIIHRDLKTSNLLLSHKGVLKIADFGLAREYGSPLKEYTAVVVTLWYRCPELLLATKKYSTGVDIWSVGCIFGELMLMKALFPGKNEKDQLDKIFKDLGTPNDKIWPGFKDLPLAKSLNFPQFPYNTLRSRFGTYLSDKGFNLLNKLLTYDPERRISAEDALKNEFFKETPLPIDPTMFPTWPAKSEGLAKNKLPQDSEPRAPSPAKMYEKLISEDDGFVLQLPISTGFTLR